MKHVTSELRQEMERQELSNWFEGAFDLLGGEQCSTCCLQSSGGNGTT